MSDFEQIIENSEKFKRLQNECISATKLSLTGITNLIVGYEDPCLVDCFLKSCFKKRELYKETYDIDAVELQAGMPGQGIASQYIDNLIFGSCEREADRDGLGLEGNFITDPQSGKRKRVADGFINRSSVLTGDATDKLLIIKNVDFCMDFCQTHPGQIDSRALWIFDNFRNPHEKLGCRILLVSNVKIKFPFKVREIRFEPVDFYEASTLVSDFANLFHKNGFEVNFSEEQKIQMSRKLCGLTYTEAGDALGSAMSRSTVEVEDEDVKFLDDKGAVKKLRETINQQLMDDSHGLTHLIPKPWEDYICPESSNFTYDIKKILRDFDEIKELKEVGDESEEQVQAIRSRMPHVIVLYGKGGVGKSAFPLHFAGLLDFDVWDFNINASHSKYVGEGPERMRESLQKISKASHVVVRIDEYDRAIGATSSSGQSMHEAHKQVEAEFMNWLQNSQEDSLFTKNNIFVVLTTNHKDNITGPLLRTGRADLVIDIADFDSKSLKETFLSAPRRMNNRGIICVGMTTEQLDHKVRALDLDKISVLAMQKGFTVRDVDTLLVEMSAHDYYCKKGKIGIPWTTENFIKIMERSQGSVKGENTCELKLGDRFLLEKDEQKDPQLRFDFLDTGGESDKAEQLRNVDIFD